MLIALIDRIRMLDNDLIRLRSKLNTVLEIQENEQRNDKSKESKRISLIPQISKEYKKLLSGTKGSNDVVVTSAFELTDEQLNKITASLKSRYGDSLNIEQVIDISLIGGFSIKCGDEVTDYSIKGKLEKLKNQIK